MQFLSGLISAVTACVLFQANPSFAQDPASAYRVFEGPVACLPCSGAERLYDQNANKWLRQERNDLLDLRFFPPGG
jgi:hypothetical protein